MPDITLHLPSQLASLADGRRTLTVRASTANEAFDALEEIAPMVRSQIFDSQGRVRHFIGLFVNDVQLHEASDLDCAIGDGGTLVVVQSVAGG